MHRTASPMVLLAAALLAAGPAAAQSPAEPVAQAAAGNRIQRYTPADVGFMTGMIHHHAQAVLMAGWAPSHGAGPAVRTLCERIVVGQRDEIAIMQRWLRDRHEAVPEADASHDMMAGMDHGMLMPGMLTAEQLTQLNGATGADFDQLFLLYMIRHHQGALVMVHQLFGSAGAAQDDNVFKLASDMSADQTTEIDRMSLMLAGQPAGDRHP
jgi:uncharacterized protein (DUF305 family)